MSGSRAWASRVERLAFWRLRRQAPSFDVVHAHTSRGHTLGVLARCRNLVVSRRVAFPIRGGWASRWKYARPARFIAVSRYVKQALIAGGVAEERISVVHDGVPLLEPSSRTRPAIAPATNDPNKGSSLALDASRAAGAQLVFSTDLASDLRHARLLLYITHQEGLGSAALLAMSASVPVIASRVGGLPEVVEHGMNGMLTDNTTDAIARCLKGFDAIPDGGAEMSRLARRTVEERFTRDLMVAGTLRVYGELC